MTEYTSRQKIMEDRLRASLQIEFLQIENQSAHHHGHAGDDGSGESHYKITISSPDLNDMNRLQQHRKIFDLLGANITKQTHSISIKIK